MRTLLVLSVPEFWSTRPTKPPMDPSPMITISMFIADVQFSMYTSPVDTMPRIPPANRLWNVTEPAVVRLQNTAPLPAKRTGERNESLLSRFSG